MMHSCLACVVFSLAAWQAPALEITNPRPTYGYLGAPRTKGAGILPGDTLHFTFEIKNLHFDEQGKAAYSIAIEIRDAQGKLFFEQKPYNSVARNLLGGPSLPCSAHVEVPLDAKPGLYEWKITVLDRTTKQSATVIGKGKVLPAGFGLVQVGLFADAENLVPTSAVGVVGDSFYFQLAAVGFERQQGTKQPDLQLSLRVLDEQGKPTPSKPLSAKINAGIDPRDRILPVQFGLTLNRAGRFTIELTAEDRVSGNSARVLYAIRVLPLE